jgi:hypothetical protein
VNLAIELLKIGKKRKKLHENAKKLRNIAQNAAKLKYLKKCIFVFLSKLKI